MNDQPQDPKPATRESLKGERRQVLQALLSEMTRDQRRAFKRGQGVETFSQRMARLARGGGA